MSNITEINETVSIELQGDIALICINNPPVNATGQVVRAGLQQAIAHLNAEAKAKVIAIYCAGRTFVAGADIREFGKPPAAPSLPDVYDELEASAIPVIAIMHGTALGGGYELGLASHSRVGIKGLKVGLPEVLLGVLPGAGGTQRLPRLVGMAASLPVILTGRHIPAAEALQIGMIDKLVEGEPRQVALDMGAAVLDGSLPTRRTGEITVEPNEQAIAETRAMLAKTAAHLYSPHACVDCVEASVKPIREGLAFERARFMDCMNTPQRSGLIHAFFAERAVANIPERKVPAREVNSLGVIGGGTMGSGIATSALLAGLPVTLIEVAQEGLDRGVATITANLDGAVKRGKLAAEKRDATLAMLTPSTDMAALAQVDLVIEAVFEKMEVKKEIFAKLDGICKPGAILATNTSYLNVNDIAACTSRPQDVIGLHFFSPAHVMRLLEIVVAEKTAPEVVASGFALAKRMKKVGVRAGVCDGFIGNRILGKYSTAVAHMLLDGARAKQIDDALEAFGAAMGPHRVGDLAGLDIGYMTRRSKDATRDPAERYSGGIADRLSEAGWNGRKTGKGFYVYENGKEVAETPELDEIMAAERAKDGAVQREFTDQNIIDRYMTAMILEAAKVVQEGIALRPVDVDCTFLFGYGFPRHRGGPLHYADTIGAAELVRRIQEYAKENAHFWTVPALLEKMAADGSTFADLNQG